MVLTEAISTLMVLFCGSGTNFQTLWDTPGSLNDPNGSKHTWELSHLIDLQENFKSAKVDEWNSLSVSHGAMRHPGIVRNMTFSKIRIAAANLYGDIMWVTDFNTTTMPAANLQSWAVGTEIINSTSLPLSTQSVIYSNQRYRLIIAPFGSTTDAWFAVTIESMSYGGFPLAYIAKDTTHPFTLPELLEGYLGCWPNSQLKDKYFTVSAPNACYEECKTYCGINDTVVAIKGQTECYCGRMVYNPTSEDGSKCFLNCPGNTSQTCGGFDAEYQSVYHFPGVLPGATESGSIYYSTFTDVDSLIELDISVLEGTTGNPAFIEDLVVTGATATLSYQLFYSTDPCAGASLFKIEIDAQTSYPANGTTLSLGLLMVRCLIIQISFYCPSVSVRLIGPEETDHIQVPVVVIQGIGLVDTTTTSSTSTTTTTPTSSSTTTTTTSTTESTTTSTTPTTATSTSTSTPSSTSTSTSTPTSTSTSSTSTTTSTTSTTSTTQAPTTIASTPSPSTTSTSTEATTASFATSISTETTTTQSCLCNCNDIIPQTNLTAAELQEKIEAIQKALAVNTTELSSYIRAKTSATDDRPSAVSIGFVGVALLVTVFGSIILIDSTMLFRDLSLLVRNIRGMFSNDH